MTHEQLQAVYDLLVSLSLSSDPKEGLDYWPALDAMRTEREAVLKLCRENCHSGVNAERHRMAHELLVLMGDRPERTER